VKLVPASVQGWISQHGNTGKFKPVKRAGAGVVSPSASLIRRSSKVLMKEKFVPGIILGDNCHIWTHQTAHSTTIAVTFNIVNLSDSMKDLSHSTGHQSIGFGMYQSLGKDSGLNSLLRTYCGTTAAAGTAVFSPLDNVRKILECKLPVLI
jgi:hypothetical protein